MDAGGSKNMETKTSDNAENKSSAAEKVYQGLAKVANKLNEMLFDDDTSKKDTNKEAEKGETSNKVEKDTKKESDVNDGGENSANKTSDLLSKNISELVNKLFSDDAGDKPSGDDTEKDTNPDDLSEKNHEDEKSEQNSLTDEDEGTEDFGERELTENEINEKQKTEIKEALERIRNGEKLTNEELGNLGEMMMDQYYISKGYTPLNKHRVTSLDDRKGGFKTGIDGVYEKNNPDGTKSYVIADAKYNTSQLSETNDGKQMSDNWIDKRLDDAVGKEKADEIRDAEEDAPDSVRHEVYHIDPNLDGNGNMHTDTQEVDSEGNKVGDKTIVEYFDEDGNRINPSDEK